MTDRLLRTSLAKLDLRVIFVELDALILEIVKRDQPPLSCKGHYLKAIACGLLTSPLLGEEERYTLRWHYGESLEILVDVNHEGGVRSTLQPPSQQEELTIEKTPGKLGLVKSSPYRRLNEGMVLADLCDPARDLATFFNLSDQVPTYGRVIHSADDTCWGLMVQALPGCRPEVLPEMEQRWPDLPLPKPELDQPTSVLAFLSKLLATPIEGHALRIHDTLTPHSFCTCARDKMYASIGLLPLAELEDMITRDGGAQVDCQFCKTKFRFEAQDLRQLIASKSQNPAQ